MGSASDGGHTDARHAIVDGRGARVGHNIVDVFVDGAEEVAVDDCCCVFVLFVMFVTEPTDFVSTDASPRALLLSFLVVSRSGFECDAPPVGISA